jgi:hypothetical protein
MPLRRKAGRYTRDCAYILCKLISAPLYHAYAGLRTDKERALRTPAGAEASERGPAGVEGAYCATYEFLHIPYVYLFLYVSASTPPESSKALRIS